MGNNGRGGNFSASSCSRMNFYVSFRRLTGGSRRRLTGATARPQITGGTTLQIGPPPTCQQPVFLFKNNVLKFEFLMQLYNLDSLIL